jgi:DMSO/TMAO reductase YedYZ heme-binding membrane subunit
MTIILTTSIISVFLAFYLYKPIHKYRYPIYAVVAIISLIAAEDANIINMGYVPFGVFLVVMYAGVLEKGLLRKRLFMVRAEYAVIATIFLLPHAFGYLGFFLEDADILKAPINFYFGLLSAIVAVPLFVTSFQFIRRRMNYKDWKRLHKAAYLFYNLVMIHLILLFNDRLWMYVSVYALYLILKVPSWITMISTKKETV